MDISCTQAMVIVAVATPSIFACAMTPIRAACARKGLGPAPGPTVWAVAPAGELKTSSTTLHLNTVLFGSSMQYINITHAHLYAESLPAIAVEQHLSSIHHLHTTPSTNVHLSVSADHAPSRVHMSWCVASNAGSRLEMALHVPGDATTAHGCPFTSSTIDNPSILSIVSHSQPLTTSENFLAFQILQAVSKPPVRLQSNLPNMPA